MTGAELRALRISIGLTVEKAAEQVDIHARTWFRYESGQLTIPRATEHLFQLVNQRRIAAARRRDAKKAAA